MLKAGFARLDITPPLGTSLAGYFNRRFADGILDPIELNALALQEDGKTVVMISVDCLGISAYHHDNLRERVAAAMAISVEQVFIAALHQHTSFCLFEGKNTQTPDDPVYFTFFERKVVDVAQLAVLDLADAALYSAQREVAEPIAFIRRYWMKDGTVATNPGRFNPEVDRPCNDADNTVRLLRFKRACGDIALVTFSTHPDVVSGTKLSADWPGFARRFVERDQKGAHCILFTGAEGDSNHIDVLNGGGQGYTHSEKMGRLIADAVRDVWEQGRAHQRTALFTACRRVSIRTRTDEEELYLHMRAFMDDYNAGKLEYKPHITELARARRIIRVHEEAGIYRHVPISVIGIGDVALVGLGGEPFTYYAKAFSALAPDKTVLTVCLANAYEGYLPTKAAFAEGGYEACNSLFSPDLEEKLVGAAAEILNQF